MSQSDGKSHILIVDDDQLSRELLEMLLTSEGFRVDTAASGDLMLQHLALLSSHAELPAVILADLQMPGLTGEELAKEMRAVYGTSVQLIAMSGSQMQLAQLPSYEAFLLKPFSLEDLKRVLGGIAPETHRPSTSYAKSAPLDMTIYARLKDRMSSKRIADVYAFCLEDALRRVEMMQRYARNHDRAAYCAEAHMISGGCGMLGAKEMCELARSMESIDGTMEDAEELVDQFRVAAERLRRMLKAQTWV